MNFLSLWTGLWTACGRFFEQPVSKLMLQQSLLSPYEVERLQRLLAINPASEVLIDTSFYSLIFGELDVDNAPLEDLDKAFSAFIKPYADDLREALNEKSARHTIIPRVYRYNDSFAATLDVRKICAAA